MLMEISVIRSFPALARAILLPATAACLAAPLHAGITLHVEGLDHPVQTDDLLAFRVRVAGAAPGTPLRARVMTNGFEIADLRKPVPPDGVVLFGIYLPPSALPLEAMAYAVHLNIGEVRWKRALVIDPAPPRGGNLAFLAQAARSGETAETKETKETKDLLLRTALRIEGGLDDGELMGRLLRNPGIRTLQLGHTPNLTSRGIARAAAFLPGLREVLAEDESCLRPDEALAIAGSHPRFDSLAMTGTSIDAKELPKLPKGLRSLAVVSGNLTDACLREFPNLERLQVIDGDAFLGERLSARLKALSVHESGSFTGSILPPGLRALDVQDAASFTGPQIWPRLTSLRVRECPGFTPDAARDAIAALKDLRVLELDSLDDALLAAAGPKLHTLAVRSAPGITTLGLGRLPRLRSLDLAVTRLDGSNLPLGLENLCVADSDHFMTRDLSRGRLRNLALARCPLAEAWCLPPTLERLQIEDCPRIGPAQMAEAIQRLPRLTKLEFYHEALVHGSPALSAFLQALAGQDRNLLILAGPAEDKAKLYRVQKFPATLADPHPSDLHPAMPRRMLHTLEPAAAPATPAQPGS